MMIPKVNQIQKEAKGMERDYAREHIRVEKGQVVDIEVEGSQEYVERRTEEHLARFGSQRVISGQANQPRQQSNQAFLPGFAKENAPILVQSISAAVDRSDIPVDAFQTEISPDLITLYSATFPEGIPKRQYHVITFVTHFYGKYKGLNPLTLKDYEDAYAELRRAAVDIPGDIRSSIKNARTAKLLYSPQEGKFALTTKGEKLIKKLLVTP